MSTVVDVLFQGISTFRIITASGELWSHPSGTAVPDCVISRYRNHLNTKKDHQQMTSEAQRSQIV